VAVDPTREAAGHPVPLRVRAPAWPGERKTTPAPDGARLRPAMRAR
jgi:hypothetical protein